MKHLRPALALALAGMVLAGCSSGTHPNWRKALEPVIVGADEIFSPGIYTWSVSPNRFSEPITYEWRYSSGDGVWETVGTASTYSRFVDNGTHPSFMLELVVNDADGEHHHLMTVLVHPSGSPL